MDQPVPIDGPVAENVFGAGSSIVLGALGVFDGLRVFNNRDTDGACLENVTYWT